MWILWSVCCKHYKSSISHWKHPLSKELTSDFASWNKHRFKKSNKEQTIVSMQRLYLLIHRIQNIHVTQCNSSGMKIQMVCKNITKILHPVCKRKKDTYKLLLEFICWFAFTRFHVKELDEYCAAYFKAVIFLCHR